MLSVNVISKITNKGENFSTFTDELAFPIFLFPFPSTTLSRTHIHTLPFYPKQNWMRLI